MVQNIVISKKEMDLINDLLLLRDDEIYQKYGYKRDETITHTARFPNGIEADIKLVICDEGESYTEGILFQNGVELTHTECENIYEGEWCFEYDGIEYIVNVIVDKELSNSSDMEKVEEIENGEDEYILSSEPAVREAFKGLIKKYSDDHLKTDEVEIDEIERE